MNENTNAELAVGQFAVVRGSYFWGLIAVTKVTAKQMKGFEEGNRRERTVSVSDVVYSGCENDARLLYERLTSSRAQMNSERIAVVERHQKRDEKLIAAARAVEVRDLAEGKKSAS